MYPKNEKADTNYFVPLTFEWRDQLLEYNIIAENNDIFKQLTFEKFCVE